MQRETRVILLLFLAGAVDYAHATTTTEEYSRHNTGWNGTSHLATEEVLDLKNLDRATFPLILALDQPIRPGKVGHLLAFLDAGGHILIATEEGNASRFLADLGSTMKVRPGNLSSLNRDHINPGLFVVSVVGNATFFIGVETIRVNRPAAVEGGEPLLETSFLTWDDTNGDGRPCRKEAFGAAVVCASEESLIVLGDPSLFINVMLAESPKFIDNLQPVVIDTAHSRTGTKSPFSNTATWIQKTSVAVTAFAALLAACRFGRKEDD